MAEHSSPISVNQIYTTAKNAGFKSVYSLYPVQKGEGGVSIENEVQEKTKEEFTRSKIEKTKVEEKSPEIVIVLKTSRIFCEKPQTYIG
jgi:hypothetical protein